MKKYNDFKKIYNTLKTQGNLINNYHDEYIIEIYNEETYEFNGQTYIYERTHRVDLCYFVERLMDGNHKVIMVTSYEYDDREEDITVEVQDETKYNELIKVSEESKEA